MDRSTEIWGLPVYHTDEPQPGPSQAKSDTYVELKSMPANPRIKKVEGVKRSLILGSKVMRKSTAPPLTPQLGRKAKSKASKQLKLLSQPQSSSKEDISGTDSADDPEFRVGPDSPDTSDNDHGLNADGSDDDEVAQDENAIKAVKKGPVIPLTDDESDDEDNIRTARRSIKKHLEEVLEEILTSPAVPRDNVFVTDEEDEEWVK